MNDATTATEDGLDQQKPKSNSGFFFVFLTVTFDMLGLGILIPILPNLIHNLAGKGIGDSAELVGIFSTCWAIAQFFSMPIVGALSDNFGRKPIFLASNIGGAFAMAVAAFSPNLQVLMFARILSGIMSASVSTSSAFIADTESPKNRAAKFGILGAAFGLGFILGPVVGGLLGGHDLRLPLKVAAIIGLCNFIYGFIFLRESLPPEKRRPFSWKRANPISGFHFFIEHHHIGGFALVKYLNDLSQVVYASTFVLYALYRFGWGERQVGMILGAIGFASVIVQGGLVRRIVPKIGEKKSLIIGLICAIIGFVGYGLANNWWEIMISVIIGAFSSLYAAAIQAFLTSRVNPMSQGRLQGALGSMTSTATIIGPVIFTHVFAYFISGGAIVKIPGAPFFLSAALVAISLIVALKVTSSEPDHIH